MRGWLVAVVAVVGAAAWAGEWPRELRAYQGRTPTLDGEIRPGEYADATPIRGVGDWTPQFSRTTDEADLSLQGWVKHDGRDLYFAFRVTDDCLYGIDTDLWPARDNPRSHELTPAGYPWFGDEMELLVNAAGRWSRSGYEGVAGNGSSWQMVCNLAKSRLGGVGVGGLLEGEPRSRPVAWGTYQKWILDGDMQAVVGLERTARDWLCEPPLCWPLSVLRRGGTYVIEWRIRAKPCLEVQPGRFWSPAAGEVTMGLNIAVGDLDEPRDGRDNQYGFHHEDWWAGEKDKRCALRQFGRLVLVPGPRP